MLHSGLKLGDRYRLDVRIGAGGMGEVWRAFDEMLARVVAVKVMLPEVADEPDFARRFLVEAKSMASVNHPAVASIHDFGRSDGITFLVMEFIDGESLSQVLGRVGRLAPADTMRLLAQAADGLQAVHDRGIVHRDIKPANLLVRRDGSLLITDFGISHTQDGTQLTISGAILGTPTYLSPEQVLGRPATGLSDVYSLGLAAYECLAGHRPFVGDNPYAVALQRLQAGPQPLGADVPGPVVRVIEGALAVEPADRWRSAAELAAAARAALHGGAEPSGRHAPPQPRQQPGESGRVAPHSRASSAASGSVVSGPAMAPPPAAAGGRWPYRRLALVAVLLVVVVTGGLAAWRVSGRAGPAGNPADAAETPGGGAAAYPGFAPCGPALCPVQPLCWGGLAATNGKAAPTWPVDCAQTHVWETFAAIPLPAAAAGTRDDELLDSRPIAAACSATLMASRSRDSGATARWELTAWPIQVGGAGPRLVHCLARPADGETKGAAF